MFGAIKLETFAGLTTMTQKAASAWSGANFDALVGAMYKPLLYLGEQRVHGTNYYFIAEQTLVTHPLIRRIIRLTIHELDGKFTFLGDSVVEVI